jgi:5-methylcytosine-specific restriction enzyme A
MAADDQRSNPRWAWDELVLVCALVADNDWRGLRVGDHRVAEASELLRQLPIHAPDVRGARFRSPASVQRKTFDLATRHPSYRGKPTHGGSLDREVLALFLDQPDRMLVVAERIRHVSASGLLRSMPTTSDAEMDESGAEEGRLLVRLHLSRERDRGLRNRKIESVRRRRGGRLACEVCEFDYEARYGERGAGYIECHHVVPLHLAGAGKTKLADLALVCANCHRMIHRRSPWLAPADLRQLIDLARGRPRAEMIGLAIRP